MRYRFLFSILLASLTACTFKLEVISPVPVGIPDIPTTAQLPVTELTPTSIPRLDVLTATPLPLPTLTFTPTTTPTPSPVALGPYPIRFTPNGTYLEIADGISYGTSRTYSISASRGQVMSVSVRQSLQGDRTVIPMQVTGADGTVLCPSSQVVECTAWRGTLPATQEYFVRLTPVVDVPEFTLRVAINPPGAATQTFQYVSPVTRTSFFYTDEFAPVRPPVYQVYKTEPEFALSYIDPPAFTGTNLMEAYFLIDSSSEAGIVGDCLQASAQIPNEKMVGSVIINDRQFVRFEGGGAATGNFYEQINYRAVVRGVCHEVVFVVHSFSAGAMLPVIIQEYDRTGLMKKFEGILSTLVIK